MKENKMNQSERINRAINSVVSELMDRVMERVLITDPFIKENHHANKPLYAALVPDEIFKGSHFERRFVTPFGGLWEQLANAVAIERHGDCLLGARVQGMIETERLRRIQEVLNRLEHTPKGQNKLQPNWDQELSYILDGGGAPIPIDVICDVFIDSQLTGKRYAFEIKAPLPNSDQTKVSKEKMFKLMAMYPPQVDFAYFALAYNPYGKKSDYNWSFPYRWFDMQNDSSVLIGDEFWELVGGKGTYQKFITEVNLLGREYKERIYREFLGIEPPLNSYEDVLR